MSETKTLRASRISRRDFMKAAGVGAVGVTVGSTLVVSSATAQTWDAETDVICVGSGGAALAGAVGAMQNGAQVIVLEKGPVVGGTTAKSGGAFWVCNSPYMQAAGLADPKDDAIRYMARLAYPALYRADNPTFGVTQATYDLLSAFYDNGSRVTKQLSDSGALASLMGMSWDGQPTPDYFAHAIENKAPRGRTTNPKNAMGNSSNGAEMVRQLSAYVMANGGAIRVENRVNKIVLDATGRVVGVQVAAPEGMRMIRARGGVIFGSGGFTHNVDMRNNYLRIPVFGGCAVPTNTGDLVNMAIEIGAKLGNMNEAWHQQEVLEEVLQFSSVPSGTWFLGGDSMIAVNKYGMRLYDEKFVYNERTRTHLTWDAQKGEYPNIYQFLLYDEHARAFGGLLMTPPAGMLPAYVINGNSWDELAANIDARLASLEPKIGHFRLDAAFMGNLRETISRFNGYAATGVDLEFHRGEVPIDKHFHRPLIDNGQKNPYLYPFAETGPYHAIILAAGTLDTKGGPVYNPRGQVLNVHDNPIPGLYVAGNAGASPSGQAYWGAGGTLGPAVTFGYMAGEHAAKPA